MSNGESSLGTAADYINNISTKIHNALAIFTEPSCRATKDQQLRIQTELIGVLTITNLMAVTMGKLEGSLEALKTNSSPVSNWSSIVKSNSRSSKIPLITTNNAPALPARPTVFVFPEDKSTSNTSESTLNKIKCAINPTEIGVKVTGIKEIKSGGIVVHPSSHEEALKLANNPKLSGAGLKATVAAHRLPRIAIHGLEQNTSAEDIINAIHLQTQSDTGIPLEELKKQVVFSHKSGPRTGTCTHIFRVPPSVRHTLISYSKLALDWQLHKVRDWVDLSKCGHCQLYGHIASRCTANTPTCSHCAKTGHNRTACPTPDKSPVCATCKFFRKPATHQTGAKECPARQSAESRELSKIDFLAKN